MKKKRSYVFIGSSSEGLDIAKAIQTNLDFSCECSIWSQGVFGLSRGPMDSLIRTLGKFDFAILVLTPDDIVSSRGQTELAARDNVVFELGLFIGRLGRERVFMVCDRSVNMRLPSDLTGIEPATYQPPESGTFESALGAACNRIEKRVGSLGPLRTIDIDVRIVGGEYFDTRKQMQGLFLEITNVGNKEIPPYTLWITHPKVGTCSGFTSNKSTSLLPGQRRKHISALFHQKTKTHFWPSFTKDREGNPMNDAEQEEIALIMQLEDSDRVLYQNNRLGKAFIAAVQKCTEHGAVINCLTHEEVLALCSDT